MLTKSQLNKAISHLPDSFSLAELMEMLDLIEKVEEGINQSDEGNVISNELVKSIIDRWSK